MLFNSRLTFSSITKSFVFVFICLFIFTILFFCSCNVWFYVLKTSSSPSLAKHSAARSSTIPKRSPSTMTATQKKTFSPSVPPTRSLTQRASPASYRPLSTASRAKVRPDPAWASDGSDNNCLICPILHSTNSIANFHSFQHFAFATVFPACSVYAPMRRLDTSGNLVLPIKIF